MKFPPHLDQGGTVAELSRPARTIVQKMKEKTRKPQGRKAILHEHENAKYHNWFTPFLFAQIENARILAGGPQWSTRKIVLELKKKDYKTFAGLNRTTIDGWINRTEAKPKWSERTLERLKRGNDLGHSKGGQKGVLVRGFIQYVNCTLKFCQANYPDIVKAVKDCLITIRSNGAQMTIVNARGIMVAMILKSAPEILEKTFHDGSTFRASESFMRKWLHDVLHWSPRKGTQAAQKRPNDWEEQCERSFLRKAWVIKDEDIPEELLVNSDQTQVLFAPGDKISWAETGSKQVPVLGCEEKRAFTVLISVASNGTVLPMQVIYTGKTHRSRPSPSSPHQTDLIAAGFLLQESGTTTYWSNLETMKTFVDEILAPYFERVKREKGLPVTQKSLWMIDVWSVHRSKEFRTWMRVTHPNILLDYVPGGCTSIMQPCDVGIQRPFKLSVKRSYQEDVVTEMLNQLGNEETSAVNIQVDTRLPVLRDRSTRWIWNAYKAVSQEELVKKVTHPSKSLISSTHTRQTGVQKLCCPRMEPLL